MTILCFEGATTNPELTAVAQRIFGVTRMSIERAAQKSVGRPINIPAKGIEKKAAAFFAKYRPSHRSAVDRIAGISRFARLPTAGVVGAAGQPLALAFSSSKTLMEQAKAAKLFESASISRAANLKWDAAKRKLIRPANAADYAIELANIAALRKVVSGQLTPGGGGAPQPRPRSARELRLKLAKLKAVRRFGFELTDWGNDVIDCGGDGLGAGGISAGGVSAYHQHIEVPKFRIHQFTHDGQSFNISPDRTFVKFDLTRPPAEAWPRAFIANVFLSESDASGDFIDFLNKFWDEIGDEVVTLASSLAMAAIGAGVGAAVGTELFPLVGTIVGAIVGAVIGLVVGWLVDSLKDDLFETPDNPLSVIIPSPTSLFDGGQTKSPLLTQEFALGNARYLMDYYWELVF